MKLFFIFTLIILNSCVPKTKLDVKELNSPTLMGKRFKSSECTIMTRFNDFEFIFSQEVFLKFNLSSDSPTMVVSLGADCSEGNVFFSVSLSEVMIYRSKTLSNSIYFKFIYEIPGDPGKLETTIFLYQEDGENLRFYDQFQTLNELPFEPNKYIYDDDPEAQEFDQDKSLNSVLLIPY